MTRMVHLSHTRLYMFGETSTWFMSLPWFDGIVMDFAAIGGIWSFGCGVEIVIRMKNFKVNVSQRGRLC